MTTLLRRAALSFLAAGVLVACDADVTSPPIFRSIGGVSAARLPGQTLGALAISANEIVLSWDDDARNESGWEVHRSTTGAAGPFTLLATVSANVTNYNNAGLAALTEYCYQVRSFRIQGKNRVFGAFSNTACASTYGPPAAPTGLTAVPRSSTAINLNWTDNATNEISYRVERSADGTTGWTTVANLGIDSRSYVVFGFVTAEQQMCNRVVAVGNYGESVSNVDCTTPPQSPGNLSAAAGAGTSIDLTWIDRSNVEDGYQVERATSNGLFSVVATLPAGATGYHDATVVGEEYYYYQVRASSDGGFSDYAGAVQGIAASGPPRAPTADAFPGGSTAVWVALFNESPSTTIVRVERSPDGVSGWVTAGSVDGGNIGFIDNGRETEVSVCYRAFARNSFGESGASNVDCSMPLAQPTNLTSTTDEFGTSTATWTDNSAHETNYLVSTIYCDYYYGCFDWTTYWLPDNSESFVTGPDEYVSNVYACGDGGCSDGAAWLSSASVASLKSAAARSSVGRAPTLTGKARHEWFVEQLRKARRTR